MKYRIKITHCAAIIANIYGADYKHIKKIGKDTYLYTYHYEEYSLITEIEYHQERTYALVKKLEEFREI